MPTYPELKHIANAIKDGSISRLPLNDLVEMNALLVGEKFMGPERQIDAFAETVRINITRVMIETLQGHITDLNKKNGRTQNLVVALTVASIIGTAGQVWYGYKADSRSEAEAEATGARQQSQKSTASTPIQAQPQTSSPATAIQAAASSASAGSSRK
jgi:hypothetical protein